MFADRSFVIREATQEPSQDGTRYGEREGGDEGQEEVDGWSRVVTCASGLRKRGRAYSCVSTLRSRIQWRIGHKIISFSYGLRMSL